MKRKLDSVDNKVPRNSLLKKIKCNGKLKITDHLNMDEEWNTNFSLIVNFIKELLNTCQSQNNKKKYINLLKQIHPSNENFINSLFKDLRTKRSDTCIPCNKLFPSSQKYAVHLILDHKYSLKSNTKILSKINFF